MKNRNSGFTLIELIIVIIIIGILAAIAVPMMSDSKVRAICAEAAVGVSTLRAALEAYKAEYQVYPTLTWKWLTDCTSQQLDAIRIDSVSLNSFNGRYFSNNCYMINSSPSDFWIYACVDPTKLASAPGTTNTSPGGLSGETQSIADNKSIAGLIWVRWDQKKIFQTNISKSGF